MAIDDAIRAAADQKDARRRLCALQQGPQPKPVKEFISRILPLYPDRMRRASRRALRHVFTSTHHYHSALIHRTAKARAKEQA